MQALSVELIMLSWCMSADALVQNLLDLPADWVLVGHYALFFKGTS